MTTRLLIVDDHRMMREGLRSLLESHPGFEVVGEAENGRDGVKKSHALRPDVVTMDLGMKELNGVDATRQICSECRNVKVVVLSTYASEERVLGALEAGASAYVLKINAYEELVKAIESVAKGGRYLSPDITGLVVSAGIQGSLLSRGPARTALSGREREVLQLVAEGLTSSVIAERIHIATRTVEQHRRRIMEKLDLHTVAELTKYAIREGIVALDD